MHVSNETPEQTNTRLHRVIAEAELAIFPGLYAFQEVSVTAFPSEHISEALAFVRDEDVWSILAPANNSSQEKFVLFSFHFTPGLDNSGFVGWLASHMKTKIGTGILVVCGQNSRRGGIFDYWGAPESVAAQVLDELAALRSFHAR